MEATLKVLTPSIYIIIFNLNQLFKEESFHAYDRTYLEVINLVSSLPKNNEMLILKPTTSSQAKCSGVFGDPESLGDEWYMPGMA